MAQKELNARIKQKRDSAANWESKNPVLLNGEIVLVDTSAGELRAKIGDGTKTYKQLAFSDEVLRNLITSKADKTAIPTVNNATLTIQKNGSAVATFTANSATNATANITVPTKTSDLTNNSGFITDIDDFVYVGTDTPASTVKLWINPEGDADTVSSPIIQITNATYTITKSDVNNTLTSNNENLDIVVTVPSGIEVTNFEAAIFNYKSATTKISFSTNTKVAMLGESALLDAPSFTVEKYGMAAIKRIEQNVWLISGNVEVVQ